MADNYRQQNRLYHNAGRPACCSLLRLLLSRSYRPTIQFYEVDNLYMMETYYEACLQTGCFSNCYYLTTSDKAQVPFDIGMHQYDIYRTELFGHQKFSKSIDFDWVRHKIFDARTAGRKTMDYVPIGAFLPSKRWFPILDWTFCTRFHTFMAPRASGPI